MTRALVLVAMLSFLFGIPPARGQSSCSVSVTAMNMGTYVGTLLKPGATPITVKCTALLAYSVALNAGTGSGGTTTLRKMTGPGSATLSYQMFQNASTTLNWGNTIGVDTVVGTGTGGTQTLNIYPAVTAGQYVAPGTYTDTITISATNLLGVLFGASTTTMSVTATVQPTCLATASALNFGIYKGLLVNMTSSISVTCTNTTTFNIGLSAGSSTNATVTTRKMTSPASATLGYALFRDNGHTQNWGNTVGTDTLASAGTGGAVLYSVYGQIPAKQYVAPQTYSDTVIATITY